jgi:ribosome-associated protein
LAKKKADDTESLKDLVIDAILEKKGQDVISLDLRDIHDTVADYFIIAHGDSSTQVNAIFQSVLETTKGGGHLPYHSEGMKNGEWVIVDFVDVVAHIFYRERRDFYQLEELWNDAKVTKHSAEAAIKPKVVRQGNKRYAAEDEQTLEDIERSLPASDRAPVRNEFIGRPFAKRNAVKRLEKSAEKKDIARSAVDKAPADKKPVDKKFAGKKAADKKFVDKKIQERKAASKKAPARKPTESKAPAARKAAVAKKTSTKKK